MPEKGSFFCRWKKSLEKGKIQFDQMDSGHPNIINSNNDDMTHRKCNNGTARQKTTAMEVETVDPLDDEEDIAFLFGNDSMLPNNQMDVDDFEDPDDRLSAALLGLHNPTSNDLFHEDSSSDDEGDRRNRKQTPRGPEKKRDPKSSPFGKILEDADVNKQTQSGVWDEEGKEGKKFRQRYRIPYSMFDKICKAYDKVDTRNDLDAFGHKKSDSRILILGVLRVLGQVFPFDTLEEFSEISMQKNQSFFHEFITWFSGKQSEFAKKYLRFPQTDEEISHVTSFYEKIGIPGTAGSVDCVHIYWDMCPAGHRADCKGKEKTTTGVFQVISSHTKKILGVAGPYFGTWNDKTIARLDANLKHFMAGGNLATKNWTWVDRNGVLHEEEGLHLICDGGYHLWKILICPFKYALDDSDEHAWSKHIESIRKDVECVFGILKKRFMVLKYPSRFHDMETIWKVFRTCCILHNMLHEHDGYDDWETEFTEKSVDIEDIEDHNHYARFRNNRNTSYRRDSSSDTTLRDGDIENYVDSSGNTPENNDAYIQNFTVADFNYRRKALIEHFMAQLTG